MNLDPFTIAVLAFCFVLLSTFVYSLIWMYRFEPDFCVNCQEWIYVSGDHLETCPRYPKPPGV